MKICMVGLGQNPIPPTGWGAVEILIWDYKQVLEELGHQVVVVNTPDRGQIVEICNSERPDFVHIQYDVFWDLCQYLDCKNVAITSHYGYIDQEDKYDFGYRQIFKGFLSLDSTKIFALSPSNAEKYLKYGFDKKRLFITPNGVRTDLFKFEKLCHYPDKSLYLAKIEPRKRQRFFHTIDGIFFAGRISDTLYNGKNHLGEWDKSFLYENLTNYANLVLLSDGEAHPLVCLEAMSAGLGLVLSEWATANLDPDMPFIDIIPENKILDLDYVNEVVKKNRLKSVSMREEIREYAIKNFSWKNLIHNYLNFAEN